MKKTTMASAFMAARVLLPTAYAQSSFLSAPSLSAAEIFLQEDFSSGILAEETFNKRFQYNAQFVYELREELAEKKAKSVFSDSTFEKQVGNAMNDALLAGRNVVFDLKWNQYIGSDIIKEKFISLRNKLDMAYDALAVLVGSLPAYGQRIHIDIVEGDHIDDKAAAHAHVGANMFCYNRRDIQWALGKINNAESWSIASWDIISMHELSHLFDYDKNGSKPWVASVEQSAEFKVFNIIETIIKDFAAVQLNKTSTSEKTIDEYMKEFDFQREHTYNEAVKYFGAKKNTVDAKKKERCELNYYYLGLLNHIGWDTLQIVYRSYSISKAISHKGSLKNIRAREFIDRIVQYSGNSNLLLELPDNGESLNTIFPIDNQ